MKRLTFFKNLFKPIKSPVGEVVGDDAIGPGKRYTTEAYAQEHYATYVWCAKEMFGFTPVPFADWLEAQGVRIV